MEKWFSKEHLVITTLRIYAHSSSVPNSVTLSSQGAQQRHMQVFWTGREKMDGRQFCGRFRYISGKRQMIHHTSDSSYSHNCESSSTAQAIRLIRRDWDDINSEIRERRRFLVQYVPSGDRLKLSSIQSPIRIYSSKHAWKSNQERCPENHWGPVQQQRSSSCPLLPNLNFVFFAPYSLAVHGRKGYRDFKKHMFLG